MAKKPERRIHYNFERAPYPNEDFAKWYFLIINEPREIGRILTRIYQQLQPILEEPTELTRGPIPNSGGLHFELLSLLTEKGEFPWNKYQAIYGGKWKKDRTLEKLEQEDESRIQTILRREGLL